MIGRATGGSVIADDQGDGTLVIAYDVSTSNSEGAIDVCVLKRGARSCESKVTLHTEHKSDLYSTPLLTLRPGDLVYVAMDECCTAPYLLFGSTDGGKSFGAPVPIGPSNPPNTDVSETWGVTGYGVHMMWAQDNAGPNFEIEIDPLNDPGAGKAVTAMTDPSGDFYTAGLGSDKGQIIAAASDSNDVTFVSVAPAASTVFHTIARFDRQQLLGMSGTAMLTQKTSGGESDVLRLYNGERFGAPNMVPSTGGELANWNAVVQDEAGRTFVFTERAQDHYDLEMQSTVSGSSWSARTNLGNAVRNNTFSGSLDSLGTGAVVGTAGPVTVFPVLAPQPVSFKLSKIKVRSGGKVMATGVGKDPAAGRIVELQRLEGTTWHVVGTTHESANGDFTFHITEGAAGHYTFRASAADLPGYLMFGYSPSRGLKVVNS